MSRSGVNWDEKIRRVYSYLVMDYLVEHNQSWFLVCELGVRASLNLPAFQATEAVIWKRPQTNLAALRCTFSSWFIWLVVGGSQTH